MMFRSAPGVSGVEIGDGPADEPRTKAGRRIASEPKSAVGGGSGDVVEVAV